MEVDFEVGDAPTPQAIIERVDYRGRRAWSVLHGGGASVSSEPVLRPDVLAREVPSLPLRNLLSVWFCGRPLSGVPHRSAHFKVLPGGRAVLTQSGLAVLRDFTRAVPHVVRRIVYSDAQRAPASDEISGLLMERLGRLFIESRVIRDVCDQLLAASERAFQSSCKMLLCEMPRDEVAAAFLAEVEQVVLAFSIGVDPARTGGRGSKAPHWWMGGALRPMDLARFHVARDCALDAMLASVRVAFAVPDESWAGIPGSLERAAELMWFECLYGVAPQFAERAASAEEADQGLQISCERVAA